VNVQLDEDNLAERRLEETLDVRESNARQGGFLSDYFKDMDLNDDETRRVIVNSIEAHIDNEIQKEMVHVEGNLGALATAFLPKGLVYNACAAQFPDLDLSIVNMFTSCVWEPFQGSLLIYLIMVRSKCAAGPLYANTVGAYNLHLSRPTVGTWVAAMDMPMWCGLCRRYYVHIVGHSQCCSLTDNDKNLLLLFNDIFLKATTRFSVNIVGYFRMCDDIDDVFLKRLTPGRLLPHCTGKLQHYRFIMHSLELALANYKMLKTAISGVTPTDEDLAYFADIDAQVRRQCRINGGSHYFDPNFQENSTKCPCKETFEDCLYKPLTYSPVGKREHNRPDEGDGLLTICDCGGRFSDCPLYNAQDYKEGPFTPSEVVCMYVCSALYMHVCTLVICFCCYNCSC
jgi:hypothetical protein